MALPLVADCQLAVSMERRARPGSCYSMTNLRLIFDCFGTVRTGFHRGLPPDRLLKRDEP